MRILVFENDLNGHRIEYIHHLHLLAERMPENQFYFVVPEQFSESSREFEWTDCPNIYFDFFSDPVEVSPSKQSFVELIRIQHKISRKLNHYLSKFSIDRIFSIGAFDYFPFVPFFLRYRVKIDGIQYSMLPWRERNIFFRYADYLKYFFYVLFPCFHIIFTLNDKASAEHLNKVFKTNKFKYLPDPYLPLSEENVTDVRKEFNIDESKTVFSHIGGMCYRKGTLSILLSIKNLSQEERASSAFVFAGYCD